MIIFHCVIVALMICAYVFVRTDSTRTDEHAKQRRLSLNEKIEIIDLQQGNHNFVILLTKFSVLNINREIEAFFSFSDKTFDVGMYESSGG